MRDEIMRLADIIGKNGAEPTESDRITFEAWMRGHCWAVEGEWTGKTYKHAREESGDYVHAGAMNTRRLFAAWRDRRALDEAIAALTDHVEDKLGMVPEGWGIEQHNVGYMVNPPDGPGCWVSSRDDFNVPLADQTLAKLCAAMLASSPAPDHSAGNCIAAMSRMKDAAMVAHKLCYEAMLKHPDVETLGDDGELHKAIHAIVGVDTPNYVASPDRSADVRVSLHRKARELLAAEYARDGQAFVADRIRTDAMLTHVEDRSLRAIVAALAQPADADADTEGAR